MTTWKPLDKSQKPAAAQSQMFGATVTDSGLRALNAADGLFLRAEHLRQMQLYAREFALVAGVAAGPGVDHGYTVELDGTDLHVSPGLAIDGSRWPLRSVRDVTLKLDPLPELGANDFWVVEVVVSDPVADGSEPVYGTLCSDPCGGTTIQPWLDEAVLIRLTRDSLDNLASTPPSLKRNRLASMYFERERCTSDPWLTPTGQNRPVGGPLEKLWRAAAPESAAPPGPVRLAVVFKVGDQWMVDAWIARRDIGDGAARAAWESRLGLRQWNVFMAHVLQFETQLADTGADLAIGGGSCEQKRLELIEVFEDLLNHKGRQRRLADDLKKLVESERDQLHEEIRDATQVSNFVELPSAGILPRPLDISPEQYFQRLFGKTVNPEVVEVQADCALRALAEAQHLDRIPLETGTSPTPYVRLLVPQAKLTDLKQLKPQEEYPWMVFTRACGPPKVDKVPVYLGSTEQQFEEGRDRIPIDDLVLQVEPLLASPPRAVLNFPLNAWARPEPDAEFKNLLDSVDPAKATYLIFGSTAPGSSHRVALMSVRIGLLVVDLLPANKLTREHVILPAYEPYDRLPEAIFILRLPDILR